MAVKIKTDMHGYVMLEPDVRNPVPNIFSAELSESGICFPSFANGKLHSLERI
jgi:hypothetical protein